MKTRARGKGTLKRRNRSVRRSEPTPLSGRALATRARELGPSWRVVAEHHLERDFKFNNFREALDFTNQVGELAEAQNHHPDVYLAWGKVRLTLWTHSIGGLSPSDFDFASRVNQLA